MASRPMKRKRKEKEEEKETEKDEEEKDEAYNDEEKMWPIGHVGLAMHRNSQKL